MKTPFLLCQLDETCLELVASVSEALHEGHPSQKASSPQAFLISGDLRRALQWERGLAMLDKMWSAKLERDVNSYQRMVGLGTAVSGDASCYDKGLVSGSSDFLWWLPCGSKGVAACGCFGLV